MTIYQIHAGVYMAITRSGYSGRGRTAHEAIVACLYQMYEQGLIK